MENILRRFQTGVQCFGFVLVYLSSLSSPSFAEENSETMLLVSSDRPTKHKGSKSEKNTQPAAKDERVSSKDADTKEQKADGRQLVKEQHSHFKKLTYHCKEKPDEGADSTPQSPPLIIDDPGTPGCEKWEINVTFDIDFSKNEKHIEAPLLDVNYGIGDNLQLKFEIPNQMDQDEQESRSGVGNAKIGVKYLFYRDSKKDLEIAFYPQLDIPISSTQPDSEINLPFLVTKKVGETRLGEVIAAANIAYSIANNGDAKDFLSMAAGIGVPLTRKTAIMGEIATEQALGSTAEEPREAVVIANVGIKTPFIKDYSFYASVGISLMSSDGQQHFYALSGLQWTP